MERSPLSSRAQSRDLLLPPLTPKTSHMAGFRLLILIDAFKLFHLRHQFPKTLYSFHLQPPRIHQLPLLLHPVQHIMLLYPMLRRIPVIRLNETLHLIIPYQPTSFLIHTSYIIPQPSNIRHHRPSLFLCYYQHRKSFLYILTHPFTAL